MFAMLLPIWQDRNSDLEFSTDEDGSQLRRRLPTSLAPGGHFFPPKVKALQFFGTPDYYLTFEQTNFPRRGVESATPLWELQIFSTDFLFADFVNSSRVTEQGSVATLALTLSLPIPDQFIRFNKAPRFSCSGALQVYRIGCLHPPRYPVIAFVLRGTIKGTRFLICIIGLYFSCFSQLSFFRL